MDERELRHRAAEADRLLREPLLIEALNTLLAEARDELERCDAEHMLEWQAKAQAARGLTDALHAVIAAGPVVPEEPTSNPDPGVT